MKHTITRASKKMLVWLGRLLPTVWVHRIHVITNYILLGKWVCHHGFWIQDRQENKWEVFEIVARQIGQRQVTYLEFGVASGESMRYWSRRLQHPASQLYGFDSFVGLPEDFDLFGNTNKGAFSQQGSLPLIDDDRVRFVPGWFEDTLPGFELDIHDVLMINCDADLYSSTKTILQSLKSHIKSGTYIYFDDMARPDHEPKAFREFLLDTGLKFDVVAADVTYNAMFFKCIGTSSNAN